MRAAAVAWAGGRRPTLAAEAGVALAWAALLATALAEAWARGGAAAALWWCTAHPRTAAGPAPLAGLPMWTLMSAATMLPAALPAVRHVAVNSLPWRRRRAGAEFLAVYLGIWSSFGVSALSLQAWWPPARTGLAFPVALGLAACWQLTPQKRRALRACHRSSPLAPRGWRADVAVARFGLRNGGACVGSCWALMLAMALAGAGAALWALGFTAVVCAEKLLPKPARSNRIAAALLALAALAVLAFS